MALDAGAKRWYLSILTVLKTKERRLKSLHTPTSLVEVIQVLLHVHSSICVLPFDSTRLLAGYLPTTYC